MFPEQQSYTVAEDESFVTVCVFLTGQLQRNVVVNVATSSSSAQGLHLHQNNMFIGFGFYFITIVNRNTVGLDFNGVATDVTFPPASQLPRCVDISISDDSILEEDEEFLVELSSSSVMQLVDTVTVVITDNDGKAIIDLRISLISPFYYVNSTEVTVEFEQQTFTVREEDIFVETCLVLTGTNDIPVSVMLSTNIVPNSAQSKYQQPSLNT